MAIVDFARRHGRKLAVAAAIAGTLGFAAAPQPAQARGDGAGIALGVAGGLVAGAAIAGAANAYNPYPYGYYAPPAPAYYAPAPAYYPRSCWDPYYRRYYAC